MNITILICRGRTPRGKVRQEIQGRWWFLKKIPPMKTYFNCELVIDIACEVPILNQPLKNSRIDTTDNS